MKSIVLLLPLLAVASSLQADTFTVGSAADDEIDDGVFTLREAMIKAIPGDLINFEADALDGQTITLTSPLPSVGEVIVDASALSEGITIDGNGQAGLVFTGSAEINNLHFTGFPAYAVTLGQGGTLTDCEFSGNGNAIFAQDNLSAGPLDFTLLRCHIHDNSNTFFPGTVGIVRIGEDLSTHIDNCVIEENTISTNGGALYFEGRLSALVENSTLCRNRAGDQGGAIHCADGSFGTLELRQSTISTNHADSAGGGISATRTQIEMRHCTVVANTAPSGFDAVAFSADGSSLDIELCIFEGNGTLSDTNGAGTNFPGFNVTSGGHNIIDNTDLALAALDPTDRPHTHAHVAPLGYYSPDPEFMMPVHALLAISPAIDAGPSAVSNSPTFDQRGFSRIANGDPDTPIRIDPGAFEASEPVFVTSSSRFSDAIALASPGGRILVERSSNFISSSEGTLIIDKSLQLDATKRRTGSSIQASGRRLFTIQDGAHFALHGIEIERSGVDTNFGAALRITDGQVIFSHGSINSNLARRGTAAFVEKGGIYLFNCTIGDNESAASGGALDFLAGTKNRIEHCSFLYNISDNGGALRFREGSRVDAHHNLIAHNHIGSDTGELANFFVGSSASFPDRFRSGGFNWTSDDSSGVVSAFDQSSDRTGETAEFASTFLDGSFDSWGRYYNPRSTAPRDANADAPLYPTFDQRGLARRAGVGMDVGAIEFDGDDQDTDGDLIPDWWEDFYGLNSYDGSDWRLDLDGDGAANNVEFALETDPTDPFDFILIDSPLPIITAVRFLPSERSRLRGGPPGARLQIDFVGTAGAGFILEELDEDTWRDAGLRRMAGKPESTVFEVDNLDRKFVRFRRITIE